MILYGKINKNGLLAVKPVTEKTEIRSKGVGKDKNGKEIVEEYTHLVTIDEQIEELTTEGWKPADEIDPEQMQSCGENEKIIAIPVDTGDRITYTYEKVVDTEGIQRKIEKLKKEVAETDYQVRKCYEYSLVGKPLPYDIQTVHEEAEAIRTEISNLQNLLQNNL
ncbi:MAG: hypothetical protein AB2L24_29405 [Mangrovibacterium sp.]